MSALDVIEGRAGACAMHSRCEDLFRVIPDRSVNLLWCDPPYFRVVDEAWDRAWKTERAYLDWLRGIVAECARVIAPNGSLYLFASPQMGGRVEGIATEYFRVLNAVTWAKPERSLAEKYGPENFRQFVPMSERVIFAETRGALGGSVLGDAIQAARCSRGMSSNALDVALGYVESRDPSKGSRLSYRWESGDCVPSGDDFARALRACGDARPEAVLHAEYSLLLRPFVAPESFTDVWTYPAAPSTPSRHPCEKPVAMLRDVVRASSRPGELVVEPFAGSFRMAEVALAENRRYLGCDADPHWASVGQARVSAACNGTVAAVPSRQGKPTDARQRDLFGGAT